MKTYITNSEWKVLFIQLCNSMNSFKAQAIINTHKKILNDFKAKLKIKKQKEIDKYKKELERKNARQIDNKILKFESKQDEELNEKFRSKFYKVAQEIEGLG